MKLSIVTTLYCSEPYVSEFYLRTKKAAEKITNDYEIVFVDDGSPDKSLDLAIELSEKDEKVKVIELSRNFGHHKAMMTGLSYANGEYVFLLDSDLEEKPELLEIFFEKLKQEKCDVVYGVQNKRKGNWFERISGEMFYFFINLITDLALQKNLITARLMTRAYVKSLVRYRERELFLAGIWQITGYKQVSVVVEKGDKGSSTYSLSRKMTILIDSITSFSNKPLLYIFYLGVMFSLLSLIWVGYLLLEKLVLGTPIAGWISIMVSVWFLGGVIILFIGTIGIYLSKVFVEAKRRPYALIRKIYKIEKSE